MKNLLLISGLIVFIILFSGCPNKSPEYKMGVFPKQPVNFEDVNSAFDDYNSTLPIFGKNLFLFFSSNRNSLGTNFDIVGDNLNIQWDMEDGLLSIDNSISNYDANFIDSLFYRINTTNNEFGPYALNYWENDENGGDDYYYYNMVTYSSNYESDKYVSKLVYYESILGQDGTFYGPFDIHLVNSNSNAQYISFLVEDISNFNQWRTEPWKFSKMIFSADNDGTTDIYSIDIPANSNFTEMLKSEESVTPDEISVLNTEYEDKCPFVNLNYMVFSSNRTGGFGGYDLYYSIYVQEAEEWTEPTNFGNEINTEYDEFRPITVIVDRFVNDLMIFSSNRPGGKGGYDLYYVGTPFKIYE